MTEIVRKFAIKKEIPDFHKTIEELRKIHDELINNEEGDEEGDEEDDESGEEEGEKQYTCLWGIDITKTTNLFTESGNENFSYNVYLYCDNPRENREWSIEAFCELKFATKDGEESIYAKMNRFTDENSDAKVEFDVCIKKISGMQLFDESMRKYSDVVFVVENEKFYVSKLFLASQSSYFDALLLGNFNESTQTEVTLSEIKASDFQQYLEAVYGYSVIDERSVKKILNLAHMYDTQSVLERCQTFLINDSGCTMKEKLELAAKYQLSDLKEECLSEITTVDEIRSVVSRPSKTMDHDILSELFDKLLELQDFDKTE
ncbi:hypothetical protein CRE_08994 [Caenorhabditis remanei]|uniref:BTB domain-containing protein n=1 Tax=Caenorhabditis remanei TaxID=31234 RepID=E3LIN3_CAERE|nr:hypothetical protein CRE_08994 [Caenorhabditis remanei]